MSNDASVLSLPATLGLGTVVEMRTRGIPAVISLYKLV